MRTTLTGPFDDGGGCVGDVLDGRLYAVEGVLGRSRVVFGSFVPAVNSVAGAGQHRDAREPLVRGRGASFASGRAALCRVAYAVGRLGRLNFNRSHDRWLSLVSSGSRKLRTLQICSWIS